MRPEPPTDAELAEALKALEEERQRREERSLGRIVRELPDPEMPGWALWLDVTRNTKGEPVRHRVAKGGRGGAKSRSFARKLLIRGTARPLRILCTRETQRSMRDSVHRLLTDEINRLGLGTGPGGAGFYRVFDKEIRGRNGTLFIFQGLHRNEEGIKSLEGIDIAWVEEARKVSQRSIDVLEPTIRGENSEIWWSYNPYLPTDPVDKMFFGGEPPPGSVLITVHHRDNPWFPSVLRRSMQFDLHRDPDKHAHIWEGQYIAHSSAKVFRNWAVMDFDVPANAVLRFGADWGFSVDPTVLVRSFIGRWSGERFNSDPIADPFGNVLFISDEAYEVGCPVDELPALFAGTDRWTAPGKQRWENTRKRPGIDGAASWKIIADSARPELIAYMKMRGFNIEPAVKGAGSLEEGVTFLQSFDICVHPRCPHTADELTHYSYKVDPLTEEVLPVLADKDNHVIDAVRYSLEAVRKAGSGFEGYASAGTRATLAHLTNEQQQRAMMERGGLIQPGATAGKGAGWGSSPSIRRGIM